MNKLKVGIVAGVAALVLIVVLQNTAAVETKFLFLSMSMPRAFLIALTFGCGLVCGLLLATRIGAKKQEPS